ncbi:MAG TPA: hypothetical protein VIX80_08825 [Candidatus Kapabacteria bacterium]
MICIVVVVAITVSSCSQNGGAADAFFKRYPIKNAYIQYEITGDGVGTEDLYIADYGRYEFVRSDYMSGISSLPTPVKRIIITRLADIYSYALDSPTGRKSHSQPLDSLYKLTSEIPPYSVIVEKTLEGGKFQLEGSEVVAGFPTQRWKQVMGPTTIFLYNGIVLKRVVDGKKGALLIQTAIKVDTLWKPDTNLFSLPKGMTFESGPAKRPDGPPVPPGMPQPMTPPR